MQSGQDTERELSSRESIGRVSAAMDRLDPQKRSILMLRANEQLSYEEIARHLNIPVGTVMSRLNRARIALLEEMKRDMQQDQDEPIVFEFRKYKQA
jgi:RNA polymerase sigma-70 factor, ECF subfamily